MWNYLKKNYQQGNSAHMFQLEYELSQYAQGSLSIQDYYSQFVDFVRLWTDYTEIIYSSLSGDSLPVVQDIHAISRGINS